jgi:hypothetical protein
MKKFNKTQINEAVLHYGDWVVSSIENSPELWTKCEICGNPICYETAIYCMNDCKSKKNKNYRDEYGDEFEVRFCRRCFLKLKHCPICKDNHFGR